MSKNFATKTATIALVLMLTMTATLMTSVVKAHDPPITIKTYGFISAAPNPVGLGQTIFLNFWVHMPAPTQDYVGGIDVWQNLTVTVTKPDHTTVVLGPFRADATGGTYTTFVPDQLGEYSFVFHWPGQRITGFMGMFGPDYTWLNDWFDACTSAPATVTVQQEKIVPYPDTPLPTGYWQRPIYSMNTLWNTISGNWLGFAATNFAATGMYNASGNFNPYTTAPKSPHIVWTRPTKFGGQLGGEFGGSQVSNFYATSQYEPQFAPIIISGRLYWTEYTTSSGSPTGWNCVDLRTGELIWHKNTTRVLMCGQVVDYESMNQFGGLAYLWTNEPTVFPNTGSTLGMYDAWTGNWILNIVNGSVPGSFFGLGLSLMADTRTCKGSILGYYVNGTQLSLWNSSRAICMASSWFGTPSPHQISWRPPQGGSVPFSWGWEWAKPVPTTFGSYSISLAITTITPDAILLRWTPGAMFGVQPGWWVDCGMSARDGSLLWGPFNRTSQPYTYMQFGPAGSGVYTNYNRVLQQWWGYSMTTGIQLWGPKTYPNISWDMYTTSSPPAAIAAYGNLYAFSFGGIVNCIDIKTGDLKWTYRTGGSGYDTPYGVWTLWCFARHSVADGKLYMGEGHEYSPPIFRGAQMLCIDAYTGKLIYSILGFNVISVPAIADGYLITHNAYDLQLYAFGKGQSATTVTAPVTTVENGTSVLIQGTVTDQSVGQTCFGTPAAGTPAIGDAYMKPWMEYLYMQQPMPTNATGVPVQLHAMGPDGTGTTIATVTSDIMGHFEYMWTPPTTGTYKIFAGFDGSDSYYASSAETGLGVTAAPAPTPAPTKEDVATQVIAQLPTFTTTDLAIIAAVAVAIVIGIVNLYALRKRK
jgi:hypothetical protein